MTAPRPLWAYVGSCTTHKRNARGEGISVYRVDCGSPVCMVFRQG